MRHTYKWLHQQSQKLYLEFGIKQTWIFLLSFGLSYFVTGNPAVSLTGALVPLLYFLMPNKDIKLKPLPKILVLYSSIAVVAALGSIATTNVVLSLTLNVIVPFLIACIWIDDSNVLGYAFHYVMFTYVQFTEITLELFPLYLISAFIGVVVAYVFNEVIWSRNERSTWSEAVDYKETIAISMKSAGTKVRESLRFDSSISRFAVRLSIATAVSITLWSCLDLPKWYWIAKATCYTLVPIWSQINHRAADRFKSTAVGCTIFAVFSLLAPYKYAFIIAALMALVLALSYIPKKHMSEFYIFGAFVSLSLSLASFSAITLSVYKVTYVLIGVLLATILNRLILPSVANKACANETARNKPTTVS